MLDDAPLFDLARTELKLPKSLYDDWIVDYFPAFQRANRSATTQPLLISFIECEWVSPLPLLAIATEVMSFSAAGRLIEIDLGEGASSDSGAYNRQRTRKFLSLHGFLNAFVSRSELNVRFQFDRTAERGNEGNWHFGIEGLNNLRETLERSYAYLIYGDTSVIQATTWALPAANDANLTEAVRVQVRDLLKQVDRALFRFKADSRKYRDVTLQRINQVLLELVENAAEHAYESEAQGFIGLYARVRESNNDIEPVDEETVDAMKIRAAKAARSQELAKSPLLHKVLLSEKQQQVELFVLDVGRGLFSNIALWKEEHGVGDARQAQPLRRTASVLFSKPLSRHNRSIDAIAQLRGGSTGLMHLNAILCHQNDNTRIVTGTEWLAGPHPRPSGFMDNSTATGGYLAQRDLIEGTFFHLGISPSVIPKLTKQWFSSDKDTHADIRQAIIRKFARTTPRSKLQSRAIDIRSGEGLRSVQTRVESTAMVMAGTIVRVNRIAEKNLVNQIVLAWIRGSAKSKQKNSTLFLCDLGRYQAIDIVWVIENMFRPKERYELEGLPADSTIFLVTEDLCCTELKVTFKARRDGKVQPQISSPAANISKLENRLVYLLEELRVCDSIVLWDRVRSLARNSTLNPNPVMLEDVLWPTSGTTKVLPSYLNFAALVQDSDAARCIRRSLRRILALFPDANDLALDSLVEASLHDAKKWLIRPQTDTSHKVLIGSLSVSGSTLKRFRLPPKTTVAGIVDCIRTPYFNFAEVIDEAPHLAALLWDPILPTTTDRTARYRRVGRSAYVEAVSNASFPVSYDEVLYTELESANLVKVGHWSHGERHSLLELNAELAIEQSAASESGAITWLVRELKAICKGRAIVLAFPVDKLAYRLAHHVKSRMNSDESIATVELSLLPMSFMPRFAGGLTRFAPLVMDAARNLATQMSAKRPIAVFLDFGFITNRTVRHAMRQLTDAGFEDIRAMGLLNRSSAPELLSEKKQLSSNSASFPHAFWRWNVPILGTGLHCPLCGALPTFGRLRRLVEDSHRDLLLPLAGIGYAWRARDITDFWEEFGLAPLALSDKIRTQLSPVLAHISVETAYTSSTLAARAIEYLRATGDSEKPLQLALVLLNESGEEHATELLCISLLLSGGTFPATDLYEYVALLSRCAIALGTQKSFLNNKPERKDRLLGLVAIVFAVQSTACKLAVVGNLCDLLETCDIIDSPMLRLALMSLTTDTEATTEVQSEFQRLCTRDSSKRRLIRNYHSLRPVGGNARESWDKLHQAFGRSPSHSQASELGNLKAEFASNGNKVKAVHRIDRIASLLAQCDRRFVSDSLGVDTHKIIEGAKELRNAALASSTASAVFLQEISHTFDAISANLHKALVRYGERTPVLIYDVFYQILEAQTKANGLTFLEDIVLTKKAVTSVWPQGVGDYFPLDGHVERLLGEVFANIKDKSALCLPPQSRPEFDGTDAEALGWIWFDCTNESVRNGITVVVVTGLKSNKPVDAYRPKVMGLSDFGVYVTSTQVADDPNSFFEIRIRIPSLASILGTS